MDAATSPAACRRYSELLTVVVWRAVVAQTSPQYMGLLERVAASLVYSVEWQGER